MIVSVLHRRNKSHKLISMSSFNFSHEGYSALSNLKLSKCLFLNQINMEMLLEIASFDGSEKQYDILSPVSPAEAAELWPTFSAEHESMELHSLVKCTFQGNACCYQSAQ